MTADGSGAAVRIVAAGIEPPPRILVERADLNRTIRLILFIGALLASGVWADQLGPIEALVIFVLFSAGSMVFVLGPGLVERIGARLRPTSEDPETVVKAARSATSRERLQLARIAVAPSDLTWRVVPRLRSDMATVLRARHGLELDDQDDSRQIEALIGTDSAHLLSGADDVETWPTERISAAIGGCLAAVDRKPEVHQRGDQ